MTIEIFAPPRRLAGRLWGRVRSIRLFSPLALLVSLFATFYALVIFAAWPHIDLSVAGRFYHHGAFFGPDGFAGMLRKIFYWTPSVVLAAAIGLFIARRCGFNARGAPNTRQLAFLIATMALGPGLLVNVALKDHSHRPRPAQIEQFGGSLHFVPFYRFDGDCRRNCSFVSGETSTAVWTLAPASFAPAPWRAEAVAAAFALSVAASVLRLSFGGHFLSDVVFSGLFTFLVLYALNWLLLPQATKPEGVASGLPGKPGSL